MTAKVAETIIIAEEEIVAIIERIKLKMLQNNRVTVRADGGYSLAEDDEER